MKESIKKLAVLWIGFFGICMLGKSFIPEKIEVTVNHKIYDKISLRHEANPYSCSCEVTHKAGPYQFYTTHRQSSP